LDCIIPLALDETVCHGSTYIHTIMESLVN
jgi:hypothetical protein